MNWRPTSMQPEYKLTHKAIQIKLVTDMNKLYKVHVNASSKIRDYLHYLNFFILVKLQCTIP